MHQLSCTSKCLMLIKHVMIDQCYNEVQSHCWLLCWCHFLQVFTAVVRHIDWSIVKCLVIAGPGFAKDSFKTYLDAEAVKRDVRPLIENKASIFTAPVS